MQPVQARLLSPVKVVSPVKVSPVKASPMKVSPVKTDQKPIPDSLEEDEDMMIDADVLGDALMSQLNVASSPPKQSPTKMYSQHSAASYSRFDAKDKPSAKSPVKST